MVQLGQVWDYSRKTGQTEFRELRQGDSVSKGNILGVFYSLDVGSKKNDLLDALVQLELDQKILDEAQKHVEAVPQVFVLSTFRAVQGDRNAINRALNNLKLWDIPRDEIDALHAEAKKIGADRDAWLKTPEGRWVNREKQAAATKADPGKEKETEDPWGKVTLRAPFDGVIVERNVHKDEMVVDNTVNLFQIADVSRLLVIASCPEDSLPSLEALGGSEWRWSVRTVGAGSATGLPGTIDEIGYLIDPNQHTAVIKGYVDNPGKRYPGGTVRHRHGEHPAPGRRGRDSNGRAGGRRHAGRGVRPARCVHPAIHDAARPGDATLRPRGVRAIHADPQGRAIDGHGGGRRAAAERAPSARRACPPRRGGGTESRLAGARVATGDQAGQHCREGENAIGGGAPVSTGEEAESGQGLTDRTTLVKNPPKDSHGSQAYRVGAR